MLGGERGALGAGAEDPAGAVEVMDLSTVSLNRDVGAGTERG